MLSIIQWFGWWGYLVVLIIGVFIGMLIAANNPMVAKWFSRKTSDIIDKGIEKGKDKLEDLKR